MLQNGSDSDSLLNSNSGNGSSSNGSNGHHNGVPNTNIKKKYNSDNAPRAKTLFNLPIDPIEEHAEEHSHDHYPANPPMTDPKKKK